MAEGFDVELKITGYTSDEDVLSELMAAMVADAPAIEWNDDTIIRTPEEAYKLILNAVLNGLPLTFMHAGRAEDDFPELISCCIDNDLSYVLYCAPDNETESSGYTTYRSPELNEGREFTLQGSASEPLITVSKVLELLKKHSSDDLEDMLDVTFSPA